MITEQLIWFIDSRFYYQTLSLDKVVHLANVHDKKIKVIIDASAQYTGRGYWHLFNEADTFTSNLTADIEKQKTQLRKFFSMSAIKADIFVNQSTNYFASLEETIAENENNLVVIENATSSKRHPIFQKLTALNAPVLLLHNKAWKNTINFLAAVDPLHEHARPGNTDENIASLTQYLAKSLKAKWVLAHCYHVASVLTKYKNRLHTMHNDGLNIFAKRFRVPYEQCVLLQGSPEDALSTYITKHHVDILVVGLVTRNILERLWIGSTTTALLSAPPCDMLMINKHN